MCDSLRAERYVVLKFAPLLALMAISLLNVTCKKKVPESLRFPGALLLWGADRDAVKSKLNSDGWTVAETTEYLRATIPADPGSKDLPAPDESPYQLTFYFQNGRLNIVQIQLRNTSENTKTYESNLKAALKLDHAAMSHNLPIRTTEAGNKIVETHSIYDTGEVFIKIYKSQIETAESRMEDTQDEMDIMLYVKKENPGITAEGLLNPQEL